jgi:hypothetical protein
MTWLDRLSLALLVAVACLVVLIGIAVTVPVILVAGVLVGLPVAVWRWARGIG